MEHSMEDTLGAILSDPDMMQKIQAMAQSLGQSAPQTEAPKTPDIDLSLVQKLAGLSSKGGIDQNQKNLLSALSPYLSRGKTAKLENAMRAARLAQMASGFINSGGLKLLSGR